MDGGKKWEIARFKEMGVTSAAPPPQWSSLDLSDFQSFLRTNERADFVRARIEAQFF